MLKNLNHIIPMVMLATSLTSQAQIANCTADIGTEVVGNNGVHYCLSKITLNWWSAHSWCRAIGMRLASPEDACVGDFSGCANVSGKGKVNAWLSTPYGADQAYHLYSTWNWALNTRDRKSQFYAFCAPVTP